MKTTPSTTVTALAFAALGLLVAFGIAVFAPTPPSQQPNFERLMFIILPLAGIAIGWFIAYLAAPIDNNEKNEHSPARSPSDQQSSPV